MDLWYMDVQYVTVCIYAHEVCDAHTDLFLTIDFIKAVWKMQRMFLLQCCLGFMNIYLLNVSESPSKKLLQVTLL